MAALPEMWVARRTSTVREKQPGAAGDFKPEDWAAVNAQGLRVGRTDGIQLTIDDMVRLPVTSDQLDES